VFKKLGTWLPVAVVALPLASPAALVTLTSPTQKPTKVEATGSYSPTQTYTSSDTTPFDHTSRSDGEVGQFPFLSGAHASNHLTLNVGLEEIRSTFNGFSSAGNNVPGTGVPIATDSATFALDIVVDTATPFVFEARTSTTGSGSYRSDITYHLYTPNSNGLNVSFGNGAGMPPGGSVSGVLLRGELYRMEFERKGSGSPFSQLPELRAAREASANPVPTSAKKTGIPPHF
jgi:hypothetical protein